MPAPTSARTWSSTPCTICRCSSARSARWTRRGLRLLRRREVEALVGLSKTPINTLMRAGRFRCRSPSASRRCAGSRTRWRRGCRPAVRRIRRRSDSSRVGGSRASGGPFMGKLSVAKNRALRAPERYADGGTLYLVVASRGSKSWVQRVTITGERRDIGLGGWPLVSLREAREESERISTSGALGCRPARAETPRACSHLRGGCRAQAAPDRVELEEQEAP